MTTKIIGLTALNIAALDEMIAEGLLDARTTQTTATFPDGPRVTQAKFSLATEAFLARRPGRGHPRASLHAVRRKIDKKAQEES